MVRFKDQNQDNNGPGVVKGDPGKSRLEVINRLEPRPRDTNYSKALCAPVADALFMLTRQWQFGEFKAEDTGSALTTQVKLNAAAITRFKVGDKATEVYTDDIPLESRIEAEKVPYDLKSYLQLTNYWRKMLKTESLPKEVFKAFLIVFPFVTPNADPPTQQDYYNRISSDTVDDERVQSDKNALRRLKNLSPHIMDIEAFISYLDSIDASTVIFDNQSFTATIQQAIDNNQIAIKQTAQAFLNWYKELYVSPGSDNCAWNPSRLEYQFKLATTNKDRTRTPIVADEYHLGDPDWYTYRIDDPAPYGDDLLQPNPLNGEQTNVREKTITLISTEAQFPGMPNKRFWAFENGRINFGQLNVNTTDVATIAFTQFGFLFSNDWFIIPFRVPVGSLCVVESIIVTDSFGFKTNVKAANHGVSIPDWTMYNLGNSPDYQQADADQRVFLPPVSYKTQEGKPIEKILFIRDEMANMVWGIEKTIPDIYDGGKDAHQAFLELKKYLLETDPDSASTNGDSSAKYRYTLMKTTPENWIPFVPVNNIPKIGLSPKKVMLQRGQMLRNIKGVADKTSPVSPKGLILNETSSIISDSEEIYLIEEEEIPREGIEVIRSFQRTRWYNGKTVCWLGRKKLTGKGEGSSGLRFDSLDE